MDSNINPVRVWRESKSVTQRELAAIIGVSQSGVAHIEIGAASRLPHSWRPAVAELGGSFEDLAEQYTAWRREMAIAAARR
jgi:DNA-binding XRE family transcriptional regulator